MMKFGLDLILYNALTPRLACLPCVVAVMLSQEEMVSTPQYLRVQRPSKMQMFHFPNVGRRVGETKCHVVLFEPRVFGIKPCCTLASRSLANNTFVSSSNHNVQHDTLHGHDRPSSYTHAITWILLFIVWLQRKRTSRRAAERHRGTCAKRHLAARDLQYVQHDDAAVPKLRHLYVVRWLGLMNKVNVFVKG